MVIVDEICVFILVVIVLLMFVDMCLCKIVDVFIVNFVDI